MNVSKKVQKTMIVIFFGFVVLNGTTFQGCQLLMRRGRKILSEVATNPYYGLCQQLMIKEMNKSVF